MGAPVKETMVEKEETDAERKERLRKSIEFHGKAAALFCQDGDFANAKIEIARAEKARELLDELELRRWVKERIAEMRSKLPRELQAQ